MKKLLKIGGITFLVIIAALIIIPIAFKGKIVQKVKDVANESVNAKVDFGDFSLSLITSFPNFEFEINDVSVINKAPFEGDTLAYIGYVDVELDLMSVIGGDYSLKMFNMNNVLLNAKVLEDGKASWDIAIPDTTSSPEEIEEESPEEIEVESPLTAGLESFALTNININYVDKQSGMIAIVKDFNQSGSFRMEGDNMDIPVKTSIGGVSFVMEGDKLANKVTLDSDIHMVMDTKSMTFTFHENNIKINELKIGLDGTLVMGDHMDFDLNIAAKENKFGDVLTLIPAVYKSEIAGIDTKGNFDLTAKIKGIMDDENLPAFDVDFAIQDGYFKYPDLPEAVENINMDLVINNKDGIIDHTVVDLKLFHFEIAKNPIDFKFKVTDLESDPDMAGSVRSSFKLENLAKAIPMEEGEEYKGGINANLDFAGKKSAIDEERYGDFKAKGQIILDQLVYQTPDLPKTIIKTGYLNFSPQKMEVSNFDMAIGKSDLVANGYVDNILDYVFEDKTINGNFSLTSNYFDLNELMAEDSTDETVEEDPEVAEAMQAVHEDSSMVEETGVIEVPKNINFGLVTSFKKIDYDDMPITNFVGRLFVSNGEVKIHESGLEILSGKIKMDGLYSTKDIKHPKTNLDLSIDEMSIGDAYRSFNTVKSMAPIAKNATGEFHTDMKITTELTDSMTPNYPTLFGKGFLSTTNLGISETDAWKNLIKALKVTNPKYNKIKVEDVKINYEFKEGRLYTKPFDLNMGSIKGQVSGWTSFDNKIEYTYALKIPTKDLGGAAVSALQSASSLAGKAGMDLSVGEFIDVDVIVTGDMTDPKYKVRPHGTSGESSVKDQVTAAVKEKVKEEVEKVKEQVKEEVDKAKAEAEAKAKAEADRLKKEAEQKAKAEAERLKKEAEEKAKKKAGDKAKDLIKGIGGFGN